MFPIDRVAGGVEAAERAQHLNQLVLLPPQTGQNGALFVCCREQLADRPGEDWMGAELDKGTAAIVDELPHSTRELHRLSDVLPPVIRQKLSTVNDASRHCRDHGDKGRPGPDIAKDSAQRLADGVHLRTVESVFHLEETAENAATLESRGDSLETGGVTRQGNQPIVR